MNPIHINLEEGKNILFVSDLHLGSPSFKESRLREDFFLQWLKLNVNNVQTIFLLGDVFDFWFEYKNVVPRGYTRLLGTLSMLADKGIDIKYFAGNHDFAIGKYIEEEVGIKIYKNQQLFDINGKLFLIGHGDGLGNGDAGYKFIKKIFNDKFCQKIFAFFHPRIGIGLANFFSKTSRRKSQSYHDNNENLIEYCKQMLSENDKINYFVYGHKHVPCNIRLSENSKYINTGDWLTNNTYAIYDSEKLEVRSVE
jgi:UDP-2,3-diacylglucosamine hydrolase